MADEMDDYEKEIIVEAMGIEPNAKHERLAATYGLKAKEYAVFMAAFCLDYFGAGNAGSIVYDGSIGIALAALERHHLEHPSDTVEFANGESSMFSDFSFAIGEYGPPKLPNWDGPMDLAQKLVSMVYEVRSDERRRCAEIVRDYDPGDAAVTGRGVLAGAIMGDIE